MKWYHNLKMQYKLLYTFGIPVFLLVVLAVLSGVQLGRIDRKYSNLIDAAIWRQNSVSKLIADMHQIRYINLTKEYLAKINAGEKEYAAVQNSYQAYAEQFVKHLNEYRDNLNNDVNMTPAERQKRVQFLDDTMHIFLNEYQVKTKELDTALFIDKKEPRWILGEILQVGNNISERLDTFYLFISTMVQEVSAETSVHSHRSIIMLLNMAGALVILSVLISLFLSRTIKEMNKTMTVMENLDSMVIVTDLDHNLKYVNQSCADAFGLDINTCKGKKCYKMLRDLDAPCAICQMKELLPKKDTFPSRDYEYLYDDRLGGWFGGKSAIIRWVDGSMVYLQSIKNETEKKKNQEQLREAKQEVEEALAAKSAFFANMSHEIRTPMNAVLGMSELLLKQNLNKRQFKYAKDIKMSASALLNIINDILDVSKLQAGKLKLIPVHYDFGAMIDNIGSIAHFLVDDSHKNISFDLLMEKKDPVCLYGDDMRLRQVLLNLLSNAIKFTEEGHVQLAVNFTDDTLQITVSDTGMGIPQESMASLFNAFEQVDVVKNRNKKGTGLGLTITKAIVEMMGGQITVESEYGKGTRFHVAIPKVLGDPALVEHIDTKEVEFCAPDAKVLVVDDNEINLSVASGILEFFSITADTAASGKEAIAMIQQKQYDLVFMDHRMPEMSGVETTKILREMGIDIPIIALTASAAIGAKDMMLEAGMNDYLWKPIEKPELIRVLQKWIPAEKLLNPQSQMFVSDEASEYEYNGELWKRLEYIEGINLSIGLNRVDWQRNVYEKSLKYTMQEIEKNDENLNTFLAAHDMEQFSIAAHGMKSSLANIGAMRLSAGAFALEKASDTKDISFCAGNLPPFLEELNELYGKLKEAFSVVCQEEPAQKIA